MLNFNSLDLGRKDLWKNTAPYLKTTNHFLKQKEYLIKEIKSVNFRKSDKQKACLIRATQIYTGNLLIIIVKNVHRNFVKEQKMKYEHLWRLFKIEQENFGSSENVEPNIK